MSRLAPPPAPNFWDRHIMPRLIGFACSQPPIMKRRAEIVPLSKGKVLEFGAGGGINAQFYDPERVDNVTGIDPSAELIQQAQPKLAEAKVPIDLVGGIAEALPFDDASFDTVLITFTLCSVQDQAQSVKEARRVLKPGGQLLFVEHGSAPHSAVQTWQRRIEPYWKRIAGGCHLTRPVTSAISAQGFAMEQQQGAYMHRTPRFLGWVESGIARAM